MSQNHDLTPQMFTRRMYETSRQVPIRPWDPYYVEPEAKDLLCIVINSRGAIHKLEAAQEKIKKISQPMGEISEAIFLAERSESQAHLSLRVNFGYDSDTIFDDFVPYWW